MDITMDQAGRVVLPKAVRNRFGLVAGSKLHLKSVQDKIVLEIVEEKPAIEVEDGMLVFSGEIMGNIDGILKEIREDRLHYLSCEI